MPNARRAPHVVLMALFGLSAPAMAAKPPPPLVFTWSDAVLASGKIHANPARLAATEEAILACTSKPGVLSVKANLTASGSMDNFTFITISDTYRDQRDCLTKAVGGMKLGTPYAAEEIRFSVVLKPAPPEPSKDERARLAEEDKANKAALGQLVLAMGSPWHEGVLSPESQERVLAELGESLRACGAADLRAGGKPQTSGGLVIRAGLDGIVEEVRFEGAGPDAVIDCWLETSLHTLASPSPRPASSTVKVALDLDPKVSGADAALAAGDLPPGATSAAHTLTRSAWLAARAEEARIADEKAAAEKAEQDRIAAEKAAADKAAAEKAAADKAAADKAAADKAAADKAAADKATADKAAADKAAPTVTVRSADEPEIFESERAALEQGQKRMNVAELLNSDDEEHADAPTRTAHYRPTFESTEHAFTVRVRNEEEFLDITFPCEPGEYVLEAAERAGYDLPFSCRSGGCLSCSAKTVSGTWEMGEQYVLEDEHIEQGFMLLCCSTVSSDAEFISHQEDNVV